MFECDFAEMCVKTSTNVVARKGKKVPPLHIVVAVLFLYLLGYLLAHVDAYPQTAEFSGILDHHFFSCLEQLVLLAINRTRR